MLADFNFAFCKCLSENSLFFTVSYNLFFVKSLQLPVGWKRDHRTDREASAGPFQNVRCDAQAIITWNDLQTLFFVCFNIRCFAVMEKSTAFEFCTSASVRSLTTRTPTWPPARWRNSTCVKPLYKSRLLKCITEWSFKNKTTWS